jgi:small subunit ribosomal protein S1
MAVHHVEAPEQVVTPGEELWVKIIDVDLERRRISLSIKQAAEGGVVSAEYQEHFGEHAYDEQGNYIGPAYEEEPADGEAGAEGAAAADGDATAAAGVAPDAPAPSDTPDEAPAADAEADAEGEPEA